LETTQFADVRPSILAAAACELVGWKIDEQIFEECKIPELKEICERLEKFLSEPLDPKFTFLHQSYKSLGHPSNGKIKAIPLVSASTSSYYNTRILDTSHSWRRMSFAKWTGKLLVFGRFVVTRYSQIHPWIRMDKKLLDTLFATSCFTLHRICFLHNIWFNLLLSTNFHNRLMCYGIGSSCNHIKLDDVVCIGYVDSWQTHP